MDQRRKYLLRVASAIQTGLLRQPHPRLADAEATLSRLCGQLDYLKQATHKLSLCRQYGWHLAAQQLLQGLRYTVQELGVEVTRSEQVVQEPAAPSPPLGQLYEELIQTEQEFDEVEYRRSEGKLVVTTAPIVLEDVRLGRFEIQLVLERLGAPDQRDALRIVALEPNPAASDERVTHPHVSNEGLCAGDASAGDTFCCEGCQQDYCEECISSCQACDMTLCRGCLRKCPLCDEYVCESCLQACHRCGARACSACLDDNVCPACIEKEKRNEQGNDDDQQCTGEDTGCGQATAQAVAAPAHAATAAGPALHADGVGQAGVLPRSRRHRNRRVRRHSAA